MLGPRRAVDFKIYGDLSSGNCLKIKYLADHLGLAYRWLPVDIMQGESRTPDFLEKNPQGQVPVIELNDGRCLAQSNAILSFLSTGTSLLPADPFRRARVDEWLYWEQYSYEPYIAVCRFHMVYLGKSKDSREPWRVERGELALDHLEKLLRRTRWLAGDSITIADISLLAYTRLAHQGGFDLASRPKVVTWVANCEAALGLEPVS